MRVLLEIGHPAHVHFFSRTIARLKSEGHTLRIVTRSKDITNDLLTRLGIGFTCLSAPASGKLGLMMELTRRWIRMISIIRAERIDVVVSISGISTSLPARLCGVRNIVFTDTEDASLSNRIAFPFADVIYTPTFFLQDLGPRHRRYFGLHELSYLQRFDLSEVENERRKLGLPESYSVIRVVANDALHDADIQGLGRKELREMIQSLSPLGRVYISSQSPLPEEFASYRLSTPLEKIHTVLAGAQVFVGESPTMAVEASLLGTPAFLVSGRIHRLGNMVCLERDHDLLRCFSNWNELRANFPKAEALRNLKREWSGRAEKFRTSSEKMDEFIFDALTGENKSCAESLA